jgi:protease IV
MKIFWKAFLASLLAILVASVLLLFLLIGMISAITSYKDQSVSIKSQTLLVIKLDGKIVERKSNNPFEDLEIPGIKMSNTVGLNQILSGIEKAKTDEHIRGIYLELSEINAGFATVEEIRNALKDFKKSGKFIYSYSDMISQKAYYLATVSDSLMLNPMGMFDFRGLNAEHTFFKKAFDKFGIEMQVVRGKNNKFKSAVEPYLFDKMSEANREQTSIYLKSIWNHVLNGISEQRKISVDSLNNFADGVMTFQKVDKALQHRFFDNLKYKDQVLADFRKLAHLGDNDEIPIVSIGEYDKVPKTYETGGLAKDRIAVVYAFGEIDGGSDGPYSIDSKEVSKGVREARTDTAVKAIVLRVNSPGGSAYGSEVIWREVMLAQKVKPVIVSMGDYAASGGYYIACGADAILASQTTITGSIGVFGTIPNLSGLLTDKIGITFDNVSTNEHSDMPSMTRKMTPFERNLMQSYVESTYDTFITHVAKGRNKTSGYVDSIGQGRVWSGENARLNGLVDEFGGLNEALKLAASKAHIKQYRIKELPKQKDTFEELMKSFSTKIQNSVIQSKLGDSFHLWEQFSREAHANGIYTRMPYNLEIN